MQTLKGGLGQLIEALRPSADVIQADVETVENSAAGFRVRANGDWLEAEHLVLATPAGDAARVLQTLQPELAGLLAGIPYTTSITLALGYRKNTFDHPLNGHGFLVPKKERKLMFGCTWVGNKFDYRVPDNMVVLRCFLGGDAMPLSDEALVDAARSELHSFMGLEAEPVFHNIARWPNSMAQYTVGHEKRVARIEELVRAIPGLYLAGNAYHGIGVPDCVRMGQEAATKIISEYRPAIYTQSRSRRNLDPVHIARQIERLIDFGVGIKRQEEILHQKIERRASHRQTADLHPQQMHGRLAMRRLDAGPDCHQLFALNQLGDQPVGLNPAGVPHLQEIDQRRCARLAIAQHQMRLAKPIWDNRRSLHSHPRVQLRRCEIETPIRVWPCRFR